MSGCIPGYGRTTYIAEEYSFPETTDSADVDEGDRSMRKAFASDFDGTLFLHGNYEGFLKQDLVAIQQYQQKGYLFGICSGRSLSGLKGSMKDEIHCDFYIMATGAQVLDRDGNTLWERYMDNEIAMKIYDQYRDQTDMIFHGNNLVYTFGKGYPWQKHISSLHDLHDDHVYGISLGMFEREEDTVLVTEDINRRFGEYVTAYANVNTVDVTPQGCSKGNGLKKLKELLNIDLTGGIGDSYNDETLISDADVGYTFHRSPAEVQKKADVLVEREEEALHDFMLR